MGAESPPGERVNRDSPLPLEGVLVVALEQAVAAPLATRKLADAGARVIKIERVEGDFARNYDHVVNGGSAYFVWLNRGKQSIVLDIKDSGDAALLDKIVARADVFVQNLVPGAAERSGFGSADLRQKHPRLVTCDISGYGDEGSYAGMKAYDNLLQAEAGIHAVTGGPDAPARVGISICDIGAGMQAYSSILEALLLRTKTGEGSSIKVSLFSTMADWMTVPYFHAVYGGHAPERSGLAHPSIAPYEPFRTGDGDLVIVSIQNPREWRRFCDITLRTPELADDPRFESNVKRVENRPALRAAIEAVFRTLGTEELLQRLQAGQIAFGRIRSVEEFSNHPQLRLQEIDTEHGVVRLPADPAIWPERVQAATPRLPTLGEHTEEIRREFDG